MAIQWDLNRVPDFAGSTMAGVRQGREDRQGRERNAALQAYARDPSQGIEAMIQADPATAIQLQRQAAEAQRAISQESEATRARHRQRALGFFTGLLQYNDPQALSVAAEEALTQNLSDLPPEEIARIRQAMTTAPLTPDSVRRAIVSLGGQAPRFRPMNMGSGSIGVFDDQGSPPQIYTAPPSAPSALEQARIDELRSRIPYNAARTERTSRPSPGNNGRAASGGGRRGRGRGRSGGGRGPRVPSGFVLD